MRNPVMFVSAAVLLMAGVATEANAANPWDKDLQDLEKRLTSRVDNKVDKFEADLADLRKAHDADVAKLDADLKKAQAALNARVNRLTRAATKNTNAINNNIGSITANADNIGSHGRRIDSNLKRLESTERRLTSQADADRVEYRRRLDDISRYDGDSGRYVPNLIGNMQRSQSFQREVHEATKGKLRIRNRTGRTQYLYVNGVRWRVLPNEVSYAPVPRGPVTVRMPSEWTERVLTNWRWDKDGYVVDYTYPVIPTIVEYPVIPTIVEYWYPAY